MKRALVTGGSGSIGAAICRRLAAAGFEVLVHANRNSAQAQSVVEQISGEGGSAQVVVVDITDVKECAATLSKLAEPDAIQVIVNNAGIHQDAPMAGMTGGQWSAVIDVSLNGFFNVTQPLLMPMIRTRWGRIINMSSVAGVMGNRGQVNYAAAKAGLHGATKSLAIELASRGITVNAIAPGVIEGGMAESTFDPARIKTLVPMKRAGKPEEVAALVAFLCSDEAGYISGQIIGINGAMA